MEEGTSSNFGYDDTIFPHFFVLSIDSWQETKKEEDAVLSGLI